MSNSSGLVHDAVVDALGVIKQVVGGMRTEQLGDKTVLAQYAQQRGDPAAILAFTARHMGREATPEQVVGEAQRYTESMEAMWSKQRPSIGGV